MADKIQSAKAQDREGPGRTLTTLTRGATYCVEACELQKSMQRNRSERKNWLFPVYLDLIAVVTIRVAPREPKTPTAPSREIADRQFCAASAASTRTARAISVAYTIRSVVLQIVEGLVDMRKLR